MRPCVCGYIDTCTRIQQLSMFQVLFLTTSQVLDVLGNSQNGVQAMKAGPTTDADVKLYHKHLYRLRTTPE